MSDASDDERQLLVNSLAVVKASVSIGERVDEADGPIVALRLLGTELDVVYALTPDLAEQIGEALLRRSREIEGGEHP